MFATRTIRLEGESRGPADDFWYTQIGTPTATGARVNAITALQLSTVFKCVRAIAETVSMLPLPVYRRLARGKERAPKHRIAKLLEKPNPWQTAMQWREMMQGHASLRGNGYSEIVVDANGHEQWLIPLHPDRVRIEVLANGLPRYQITDPLGRQRALLFGEVVHLQGFAVDAYEGVNPIQAHREAFGAAISSRDYGARYFANSARPPTWIEFPGKFKDDVARRQWVADYRATYGGRNTGTSPVFENGMKLHAIGVNNTDAQWLEHLNASAIDIAGLFRVPPHKIGILSEAKWANIEHQQIDWATDCILPWSVRWEQTLLRDLYFDEDYFAEHLVDMLLRGDTKTRYDAYGKGIQDGWLLRNEAREKENLNPIDGLDTPLQPMNMAPAGSRGASQHRGQDPDARAIAIQTAAAERIVRKEAKQLQAALASHDAPAAFAAFFKEHERFVAEVMAVSVVPSARGYCADSYDRLLDLHSQQALTTLPEDFTARQVAALLRLEP